jgi:hypothetical protein
MRATTASGVPAGTESPPHEVSSTPRRPCSAKVGTWGSAALRFVPAMPSALSLEACTCG